LITAQLEESGYAVIPDVVGRDEISGIERLIDDDGNGVVEQNYALAVEWYREAAKQGHGWAQCNLADKYEHGLGVQQDYAQALGWYLKSAAQGVAPAMYSLGGMHKNGLGVEPNDQVAAQWWRQAAALGYEDAKKSLKVRYSLPATLHSTISPTSNIAGLIGTTVQSWPDSIRPIMEWPCGRNETVSPALPQMRPGASDQISGTTEVGGIASGPCS
jgi:TPR repeat protein